MHIISITIDKCGEQSKEGPQIKYLLGVDRNTSKGKIMDSLVGLIIEIEQSKEFNNTDIDEIIKTLPIKLEEMKD